MIKKAWCTCTITIRIGILISVAIASCIVAMIFAQRTIFKKQHLEAFAQQQQIGLQAYAKIIDADLKTKLTLLTAVADGMAAHTVADPFSAQAYLWTRPGLIKMFDDGLMLLSPQGILVAETPVGDQKRVDNDFSNEPWFQQARESASPVISAPFFSFKGDFYPIVAFIAPIRDPDHTIIGYLGGGLRLTGDNILGNIANHQEGKTDCFVLFAADRTILVHHLPQRILQKDIPDGAIPLFDQAIAGFNGSGETVNLQKIVRLSSFQHLTQAPWILGVNTPIPEVMASFYKHQWGIIAILVSSGALAIFLSWWALLRFTKPMFRFAQHLQSGADTEFSLALVNGPELNRVIQQFNRMLARIKEGHALLVTNEELQRTLLNATPDLISFKDGEGRWLLANHQALTFFSIHDFPYQGKTDRELASLFPQCQETLLACEQTDQQVWEHRSTLIIEESAPSPSGEQHFFEVTKTPLFEANGSRKALVIVARDITHRKQSEDHLRKLSQVVEQCPVTVVITDLDGNIEFVNPQFTHLTGYSFAEAVGQNPRILKGEADSPNHYIELWQAISSGQTWTGEFKNRKKNGEEFIEKAIIAPIFNAQGIITNYMAIKEDITEKKQSEELIWRQANFDTLTNLPNRRSFAYHLENTILKSKRDRSSFSLIFLDLDHFKDINDTLGHDQGDILLIEAAQRILHCVRDSDIVARLGGDEFVILLANININLDLSALMEKILATLSAPFSLQGKDFHISASIGVAIYPNDGHDGTTLLKNADLAMYYAKASGRNNWKKFQEMAPEDERQHSR